MPTVIINICDPHFTERRPRSRKDDYKETQKRKVRDIYKLARGVNIDGVTVPASAITYAGDLFHQPKGQLINRSLDTDIAELFRESPCPVYGIPGNHDMDRGRVESLRQHPFGMLAAAGLITVVDWPAYAVVGTNPKVIITGKRYVDGGPREWLRALVTSGELKRLKEKEEAQAFIMTHCFWQPAPGEDRGEVVIGYEEALNTGINVHAWGHPHSLDGVHELNDQEGKVIGHGPGALVRGTLAEHDTSRKPMFSVIIFDENPNKNKVILVPVPHEPAEKVFDLERHKRVKEEKAAETKFIEELQKTFVGGRTLEEVTTSATATSLPAVVTLVRQYYTQAEAQINLDGN